MLPNGPLGLSGSVAKPVETVKLEAAPKLANAPLRLVSHVLEVLVMQLILTLVSVRPIKEWVRKNGLILIDNKLLYISFYSYAVGLDS